MSVALQTKPLLSSSDFIVSHPTIESTPHVCHVAEAPERREREREREAPESRVAHWTEAPDAGEGRAALLEHEFTHGRSQS
jgi:hypothetical protein